LSFVRTRRSRPACDENDKRTSEMTQAAENVNRKQACQADDGTMAGADRTKNASDHRYAR
jgi:hypothetical protein